MEDAPGEDSSRFCNLEWGSHFQSFLCPFHSRFVVVVVVVD